MGRLGATAAIGVALLLASSACGGSGDDVDDDSAVPTPTTIDGATSASTSTPDGSAGVGRSVDDIAVAHTPEGGWRGTMPPPVLAECTDPLAAGAPDLGGLWQITQVDTDQGVAPDHPALNRVQRIEQCGDRLVVTAGGVVHDMRVDGTEANGVNDVAERDFATPITVVATYEDGVHVLRPVGLPIEVTRRRAGQQLVWTYLTFTARLDRIGPADADPGATIGALEAAPQPIVDTASPPSSPPSQEPA